MLEFVHYAACVLALLLIPTLGWALGRLWQATRRQKQAERERAAMVAFLDRYSESILTSADPAEWMKNVARHVAATLEAQAVGICLAADASHLEPLASAGDLPPVPDDDDVRASRAGRLLEDLRRPQLGSGEGLLGEVALTGTACLANEFGAAGADTTGVHSFLAVPMTISGKGIGVLWALNKQNRDRSFTVEDQFLLQTLSGQVALGGLLVQAYRDASERDRLQQELKLAQRLQEFLLPKAAPESDDFRIAGVNVAARAVSGDFFDFVELDPDLLLVVVADASGKGIPACILMALCRSLVRANAARFKEDLEGFLKCLNEGIYRDTEAEEFITMACCLIDRRDNTVHYARAGHTELLIRTPAGEVQTIFPDGPALGVLPQDIPVNFDTFSFSWLPGTSLLLFTDGITEAANERGEDFGLARLIEVFKQPHAEPQDDLAGIRAAVETFSHGLQQTDDRTIVVLTRT